MKNNVKIINREFIIRKEGIEKYYLFGGWEMK